MTRILIVEDDSDLARLLSINLTRAGYEVQVRDNGRVGLEFFNEWQPELVMLDVDLPELGGMDVCKAIREVSNVPVLMMTGYAISEIEIARGLNAGADEYMLKPMGNIELSARIRALLRRADPEDTNIRVHRYEDGYLSIDLHGRYVRINGKVIRLTPTEYKLLATFVRHQGEVLTFEQLLEAVWGHEYQSEHHYPRIYVSHLRRKIEPDPQRPKYIQNEYGIGYRFIGQVS